MAGVPDKVKLLLEENPALELIEGGKKVKCSLTGHEIPAREEIIKLLLGGKKYQRQLKLQKFDYDQYKPHIVPSEKKWNKVREQLFCKLTLRHLNRDPSHVQKYVSGKRYTSALARWEECQRTGQPFYARGGSRHNKEGAGSDSDNDDEDDDDDEEDSKPAPKKKKQAKNKKKDAGKDGGWKDLENTMEKDADRDESSDSLADLYPAEDFEVDKSSEDAAGQSGSDSEFDDDEEIPEPTKKTQKAGQKRKGAADAPSNTKQKPQKKKQKPNPAEDKMQKQSPNKGTKQKPNPNEGNKQKQKKQKKKTKKLNNSVTLSI